MYKSLNLKTNSVRMTVVLHRHKIAYIWETCFIHAETKVISQAVSYPIHTVPGQAPEAVKQN